MREIKEFTGRVCDCCGINEPFQKYYTLSNANCSCCKVEVLLCFKCLRFNILDKLLYNCVVCRRDNKLEELGI